jgi:23S rRNA (cytidine1920-2'-O)/16S rRNA (cytidine1409-2'-O)-methyltransferase
MSRLDIWLFENQFAPSRSKAHDFIERGLVKVNGVVVHKTGYKVKSTDKIEVEVDHYVSRSAHKLIKALDVFQINAQDKTCLDVGASTGGFTQVLLERHAKYVYAVDVGHNQLADKIKNHPKVKNMEGINIKELADLPEKIDLIVVDVSFISVIKILPKLLEFQAPIVVLIKPQFETTPQNLNDGIVKDEVTLLKILNEFKENLINLGLDFKEFIPSPLIGKDGNQEFLTLIFKK